MGASHRSWRCAADLLYGCVCGALRKRQSAPRCDNGYENGTGHYRYGYERGWYMHAYIDDEVYVPFRDERTESYEKQCGVSAHVLGEDFWTLAKEPTKLLVFDRDPQVMAEVERVLSEKFSYATNQVKSKPEFFEMNRKGMSKGAALAELCDRWGIPLSGLMTFGNGHNDISMFNLTDWSFAVENAAESAKAAASFHHGIE